MLKWIKVALDFFSLIISSIIEGTFSFKKKSEVFVKIHPWKLKGKIMTPDAFLFKYFGIYADTWKIYRKNWNSGIRRKKILVKPKKGKNL